MAFYGVFITNSLMYSKRITHPLTSASHLCFPSQEGVLANSSLGRGLRGGLGLDIKNNLDIKKLIVFVALMFILASSNSFALWGTLKTDHFTVFYKSGYESQAQEFLSALEYYRSKVENLVRNNAYHVPIIIEDVGTISNGMTDPITNRIFLYTYPPSASGFGTTIQNWTVDVGVHEYTHLLHLTKVGGLMEAIKVLFGNYFIPNLYSFGWVIEGITVYSESQLSLYQGRLNDGYYASYVAARIRDNRFPSILEAAYPPIEYPYGDGIYNYGGMFFDYLAKTYGEDKFATFFDHYGSSLPVLMFGMSASQVYGKSLPKLWKEWKQYESERFKDFRMDGERLTNKGWYASDLIFYKDNLYYTRIYIDKTGPFSACGFTKIMQRDIATGKEKCLVSTTSSFTTPIKIHNNRLYYAVAEIKHGYANSSYMTYGFYSIVHEKDLTTGEDHVCLKDGLRDFEILKNGSILYSKDRKYGFGSEIIIYDRNSKDKKLFESEYLIDRIVSDGNRIVVSARKDWENYNLYELDVDKSQLTPIVRSPYFEGFQSLCGDKLFFTANYGKVYSSYCYDLSSGKVYRLTQDGYSSYPAYDDKNQKLYYVGLNSYGFDIYAKNIEWNEFQIPDTPPYVHPVISIDENIRKGNYLDDLKTLIPNFRFPLFSIGTDKEGNRLGFLISGEDALGHFPYSAEVWYDLNSKEPLFDVALSSRIFAPLMASVSAYKKDDKKKISLDVKYPFLLRLSPGLTEFSMGLSGKLLNDSSSVSLNRREFMPYLTTGFSFPTTDLGVKISVPLEREAMGSSTNRNGVYGELDINQYIKKSELRIKALGVYDSNSPYDPKKDDKEDSPFPVVRGYNNPLDAKIGASLSVDLTAPILSIKRGIFLVPYVFFDGVCAGLFYDASIPKGGKNPQMSTGLELHLETNLAMYLPMDIGARFVITRNKKPKAEPFIGVAGTF